MRVVCAFCMYTFAYLFKTGRPTFAFSAAALEASVHAPQRKSLHKRNILHAERQLMDNIVIL